MTKNESFITDEEAEQQWGIVNDTQTDFDDSIEFRAVFDDKTQLWKRLNITHFVFKSKVEQAIREARIDELDNLYNRGHTAERASVPNENSLINFDQPDWITISTPIFYCYMSTIKERIYELTNLQKETK